MKILITTLLVTVFTNIASASTCSESMQSLISYEARHNNAITKYEHTVKQLEQGKTQERFIEHGEALNELHETAVTLKQATKKFGID